MSNDVTRVFHDWEFLDDGKLIIPISVGMVADDGRELYRVFRHDRITWTLISSSSPWLRSNVLPQLPINWAVEVTEPAPEGQTWLTGRPDPHHKDASALRYRNEIARDITEFFASSEHPAELWGYYSAYDHVVLAQLFGRLIDRPDAMPMWTNDLQQVIHRYRRLLPSGPPPHVGNHHHALHDARWNRDTWEWLDANGVPMHPAGE